MKKIIGMALTCGMALGVIFGTINTAEAKTKIISYKNCTALNQVYKGGVAKSSKVKNKGGKTKYTPFISSALYNANKTKDRDKDGIACER